MSKHSRPGIDTASPSIRINVYERYDLRHWARQFAISEQQLCDIVSKVGTSAEEVRRELTGSYAI